MLTILELTVSVVATVGWIILYHIPLTLICLGIILLFNYDKYSIEKVNTGEKRGQKFTGIYITNWHSQIVLRYVISFWSTGGIFTALLVAIERSPLENNKLLDNPVVFIISALAIFVTLCLNNQKGLVSGQKTLVITTDHVGIVTWLGNRIPIFLDEGEHPWLPFWLGFGISKTPLFKTKNKIPDANVAGPEQGLVYVGKDIIELWDTKQNKNPQLENVTRGGSSVFATFLIAIQVLDPLRYAKTTDPIMQIAEQARAGLRKAFSYFRDIDVTSLKSVIATLTIGDKTLVAFTSKPIDHFGEGSVVRDKALNLFAGKKGAKGYESQKQLRKRIRKNKHNLFEDGSYKVVELDLSEKLKPTIQSCGAQLLAVAVGNITLTKGVSEASQEAEAASGPRRVATLALADAQVEARKRLTQKPGEEVDDMTRVIALMQSGVEGAQIVLVPGSEEFSKAAATHATLSKNKGA